MSGDRKRPRLSALGGRLSEHAPDDGLRHLDCRDLNCPLPVLKARKALAALPAGARLIVEATDPMARLDIPHMCAEDGHTLLGQSDAGGIVRFEIRRG